MASTEVTVVTGPYAHLLEELSLGSSARETLSVAEVATEGMVTERGESTVVAAETEEPTAADTAEAAEAVETAETASVEAGIHHLYWVVVSPSSLVVTMV